MHLKLCIWNQSYLQVMLYIVQPSVKYPPITSFWMWIPGITLSCSVEFHPEKSPIDFHRIFAFGHYNIIHNTSFIVFFVLTTWPVHCILVMTTIQLAIAASKIKHKLNIDFLQRENSQSNVNTCIQTLNLTLTLSCSFSLSFFINTCVPSFRSVRLLLFSQ